MTTVAQMYDQLVERAHTGAKRLKSKYAEESVRRALHDALRWLWRVGALSDHDLDRIEILHAWGLTQDHRGRQERVLRTLVVLEGRPISAAAKPEALATELTPWEEKIALGERLTRAQTTLYRDDHWSRLPDDELRRHHPLGG